MESWSRDTIFLSDWPGAGTGAGAGHGAPDGGDGGGRHAAAAGRGAGQVSCDWRGAGHVTTVLTSDWLQEQAAAAGDTPPHPLHTGHRGGAQTFPVNTSMYRCIA